MVENKPNQSMDDLLANPFTIEPLPQKEVVQQREATAPVRQLDRLSEEDQEKARQLASQIPTGSYEAILTYGANAQTALSAFSNKMLDHVQSKDIGPVGDILKDLMTKLNELDPEDLQQEKPKGLRKLFGKVQKSIQEMMSKYTKLSTQIDRIGVQLEHSKRGLVDDVKMLDELYEQNKTYFEALNVYIAAAEIKRDEIMNELLPKMRA
ncbi:MAG: toxic anion resistance protein, partial [Kurthia sp.]